MASKNHNYNDSFVSDAYGYKNWIWGFSEWQEIFSAIINNIYLTLSIHKNCFSLCVCVCVNILSWRLTKKILENVLDGLSVIQADRQTDIP